MHVEKTKSKEIWQYIYTHLLGDNADAFCHSRLFNYDDLIYFIRQAIRTEISTHAFTKPLHCEYNNWEILEPLFNKCLNQYIVRTNPDSGYCLDNKRSYSANSQLEIGDGDLEIVFGNSRRLYGANDLFEWVHEVVSYYVNLAIYAENGIEYRFAGSSRSEPWDKYGADRAIFGVSSDNAAKLCRENPPESWNSFLQKILPDISPLQALYEEGKAMFGLGSKDLIKKNQGRLKYPVGPAGDDMAWLERVFAGEDGPEVAKAR